MNEKRTPRPIGDVALEAKNWLSTQRMRAGVGELSIQHDKWCVALKPPGTHCNCAPVFAIKGLTPQSLGRIVADERRRTGR